MDTLECPISLVLNVTSIDLCSPVKFVIHLPAYPKTRHRDRVSFSIAFAKVRAADFGLLGPLQGGA